MSRFAKRTETGRLVLTGGCQCPGKPHDEDWIEMRRQLGGADLIGTSVDVLENVIVAWNLLDDDGEPAPIDRAHCAALFKDSFEQVDAWITEHVTLVHLPNPSGGDSLNGSRVPASSVRGKRTPR